MFDLYCQVALLVEHDELACSLIFFMISRGELFLDQQSGDFRTGNLFLDHLPRHVFDAIRPSLMNVSAKHGEIVFERDQPIEKVLFPIHSIISVVLEMSNGGIAEVGIIGREGMSGIDIALGKDRSQQRGVVQVPDSAECMSVQDFRAALENIPEFKVAALEYVHAALTTYAHMSACNTLHSVNERCARWFLMAHDRVGDDTYYLTHEFLSQMLGVRRSSVTLAASSLQACGFITYVRGQITVLDRPGLESVSCECYWNLELDLQKLMGYSTSKTLVTTIATPPYQGTALPR